MLKGGDLGPRLDLDQELALARFGRDEDPEPVSRSGGADARWGPREDHVSRAQAQEAVDVSKQPAEGEEE